MGCETIEVEGALLGKEDYNVQILAEQGYGISHGYLSFDCLTKDIDEGTEESERIAVASGCLTDYLYCRR